MKFFYFLPLLPLLTILLLCTKWHGTMNDLLNEEAQERDLQGSFILSLAGFSFTAVAALSILDASVYKNLYISVYFSLVSFLAFMSSLNMQSYKARRWQNLLSYGLIECGTFSLILTIASILYASNFSRLFKCCTIAFALAIWLIDHIIRHTIDYRFLNQLTASRRKNDSAPDSKKSESR